MTLHGWRQPKRGRWRLELASFVSGLPDSPVFQYGAVGLLGALALLLCPHRLLTLTWGFPVFGMAVKTLIGVGTVANDGTGDPLRTSQQKLNNVWSRTYIASAIQFGGVTNEQIIQNTIVAAAADGVPIVQVPAALLPYNASLVTFNPGVKMTREGGDQSRFDVRAYGATGNGIVDDRPSIVAAQAGAVAVSGAVVYFPVGSYAVSDYVDASPGTIWVGEGIADIGGLGNVTIVATGPNKGCLRWRPGSIGSAVPIARELFITGISFSGTGVGTNQGHLVTLARIIHARFLNCSFNNTLGQGLKDDQVTLTGAAGIHLFGCEVVSFIDCNFENNKNSTNGAGVLCEDGVHGLSFGGECHFGSNTYAVRASNFTSGNQNAEYFFNACFFFGNKTVLFADVGGIQDLSFASCHVEGCTAVDPAAMLIDGTNTNPIQNCTFLNCSINFPNTTSDLTNNVNIDCSSWINCRFTATTTASNCFLHGTTLGANTLIGCLLSGITNLNADNARGFDKVICPGAGLQAPRGELSRSAHLLQVTLADGANVPVDLRAGTRFFLSAAGSRAINNPSPNYWVGGYSQLVWFTIKNTTGGAVVTTWGTAYHLAGAWVDPAAGKQRAILFETDANLGVLYEISRSAADVTP